MSGNFTAPHGTINEAERCANTIRPLTRSTSTKPKEGLPMNGTRTCSIDGCTRKYHARGFCKKHYDASARASVASLRPPPPTLEERFWAKVEKTDSCWLWTAGTNGHEADGYGYGIIRARGKHMLAHRLSFEWASGKPIPDGLQIDHMCHVRICVNPDHLQAVTVRQNGEHRAGPQRNSKTGIRGVFWKGGRYEVCVTSHKKQHHGGRFDDIEEAARAVVELRNRLMTNNLDDRGWSA